MGRSIELVQLKSMTVNVVCREPTSRQKSASAVVLAVPLIYLMSEVNWAMNSRCLSYLSGRFWGWEERAKVKRFVVDKHMELATFHKVAEWWMVR